MNLQDKLILITSNIMREIEASPESDVLQIIKDECHEQFIDLYEYSEYIQKHQELKYKLGKALSNQNYDREGTFKHNVADIF